MTAGKVLAIDVDFDLICPWCYIGLHQLVVARSRFASAHPQVGVETAWYPVQLLPDVPEEGLPFAEFYERRLGSPEAVRARRQQVTTAARSAGLEIDLTAIARMPNTARAHRLLRGVERLGDPGLYERLLERLFAAYFQRGEDINDDATLRRLAGEVGTPMDRLDDAMALGARTSAPRHAVSGVPQFLFNGRISLSGAQDPAIMLAAMRQALESAHTGASA